MRHTFSTYEYILWLHVSVCLYCLHIRDSCLGRQQKLHHTSSSLSLSPSWAFRLCLHLIKTVFSLYHQKKRKTTAQLGRTQSEGEVSKRICILNNSYKMYGDASHFSEAK